jgi:ankyrin repeat protein
LEELKAIMQKGFHFESHDGRKHTALSEAACQGHIDVVKFLLENGADPNALNDNGRSPLWRASFNGHVEVVQALLEAGANPQFRDKVSMESAYDVATKEDVQKALVGGCYCTLQNMLLYLLLIT